MERQTHLYFQREAAVDVPFRKLIGGIESMLRLATPATRPAVHAGWARYQRREVELAPGSGMQTVVDPSEEHEAWLERDGQEGVDAMYAKCLRVAGPPEIGVSIRWVPNFDWQGRQSFPIIGLDESARHEGHAQCHYLHVATNTALEQRTWILVHLAFPFSEASGEFDRFATELEHRLGVSMSRRYWIVRSPIGRGRWKLSKLVKNGGTPGDGH